MLKSQSLFLVNPQHQREHEINSNLALLFLFGDLKYQTAKYFLSKPRRIKHLYPFPTIDLKQLIQLLIIENHALNRLFLLQ